MWTRIVVLGTGTSVGKTTVARALAQVLAEHAAVAAVKPVETGYCEATSDAAALAAVSRGVTLPRKHPLYAFEDPVSPHLAARRAGVDVRAEAIVEWLLQIDVSRADVVDRFLIVETAGGALSPLSEAVSNLDLARALEPALLMLVAPDSLGVLHDVRATVTAMRALHRAPDQLVLSRARPIDDSTGTNAQELGRLGLPTPAAVIGADLQREIATLAARIAARRAPCDGSQGDARS